MKNKTKLPVKQVASETFEIITFTDNELRLQRERNPIIDKAVKSLGIAEVGEGFKLSVIEIEKAGMKVSSFKHGLNIEVKRTYSSDFAYKTVSVKDIEGKLVSLNIARIN